MEKTLNIPKSTASRLFIQYRVIWWKSKPRYVETSAFLWHQAGSVTMGMSFNRYRYDVRFRWLWLTVQMFSLCIDGAMYSNEIDHCWLSWKSPRYWFHANKAYVERVRWTYFSLPKYNVEFTHCASCIWRRVSEHSYNTYKVGKELYTP